MLDKYAPVFADELGCCSQVVGIQVNPDTNLKVHPFRRPPIHHRGKIEGELKRNVERDSIGTGRYCSLCSPHVQHYEKVRQNLNLWRLQTTEYISVSGLASNFSSS